jgi:membrane dipeptidase
MILAAGIAAAPHFASGAASDPLDNPIVVNALGGLDDPNVPGDASNPLFSDRVLREGRASGLTAVNCTIVAPGEPFEAAVKAVGRFDAAIRRHPRDLVKILSVADIRRAKANGQIGIIYGFQNAALLDNDAGRVDIFADLGVRVIQLTYNPANQLGGGSGAAENVGLTPFGQVVIERLNARNIMVDLSHSGRRTCLDAIRASKRPISINHTGCRALSDRPRNKTDEELRLVAERGGFIGIYSMPFLARAGNASASDVVAHIDHAVNVCGEDHVGIGTDGSVTQIDDFQRYAAVLAKEFADRSAAGISAAGEGPDIHPFVMDLRGPDQFRKIVSLLAARGYTSQRLEKIMGANFLRFASSVWGE